MRVQILSLSLSSKHTDTLSLSHPPQLFLSLAPSLSLTLFLCQVNTNILPYTISLSFLTFNVSSPSLLLTLSSKHTDAHIHSPIHYLSLSLTFTVSFTLSLFLTLSLTFLRSRSCFVLTSSSSGPRIERVKFLEKDENQKDEVKQRKGRTRPV